MPKGKKKKVWDEKGTSSLEDKFIEVLNKNHISFGGKLFNMGNKLYLPDFVFDRFIVEVEDCVCNNRMETIREFKKNFGGYKIVLLTADESNILNAAKEFDEVFDFGSMELLLGEIRKNMNKGLN